MIKKTFYFGIYPILSPKDISLVDTTSPTFKNTYFIHDKDGVKKFIQFQETHKNEQKVLVISGHFGSGKTCFSKLVQYFFEEKGFIVLWFNFRTFRNVDEAITKYPKIESIERAIIEAFNKISQKEVQIFDDFEKMNKELVIIIDEIERAYDPYADEMRKEEFTNFLEKIKKDYEKVDVIGVGAEPQIYVRIISSPFCKDQFYVEYFTKDYLESMIEEYNNDNQQYKFSQEFIDLLFETTEGNRGYCGCILSEIVGGKYKKFNEKKKTVDKRFSNYSWDDYINDLVYCKENIAEIVKHSGSRLYETIKEFFSTNNKPRYHDFGNKRMSGIEIASKYPFLYVGVDDTKTFNTKDKEKLYILKLGIKYGFLRRKNGNFSVRSTCWITKYLFYQEYTSFLKDEHTPKFNSGNNLSELVMQIIPNLNKDGLKSKETHLSGCECPKESVFHCEIYRSVRKIDSNQSGNRVNLLTEANVQKMLPKGTTFNNLYESASLNHSDIEFSKKGGKIDLVIKVLTEENTKIKDNYIIELLVGKGNNKSDVKKHWFRNVEIYGKINKMKKHIVVSFHHYELKQNKKNFG